MHVHVIYVKFKVFNEADMKCSRESNLYTTEQKGLFERKGIMPGILPYT